MPSLNILTLNQGDTQADIRNKVNANFDSLVANGGGPQGVQGPQGEKGPVGQVGPQGDPGQQGIRGTKWFVEASAPTGGTGDTILVGDFWVDTFNNNNIYEYSNSGWVWTGDSLQSSGVFTLLPGISGPVPGTNAIVLNTPFPNLNTLVISDSVSSTPTANPSYAKTLISTDSNNDFPLLEFSKTNASGLGTPADYNRHPQFRWLNPTQNNYNLLFSVPQDSLEFKVGGNLTLESTAASLFINSAQNLTVESGSGMSIISAGTMSFNSGSSPLNFTSSFYNLSSSGLGLSVPVTITNNLGDYALKVTNNSGSGSGVSFAISSGNSLYSLANFVSAGTPRFNIRGDGKVTMRQSGTAVKFITSSRDVNYSGADYWYMGTNQINYGNTVYFEPPSGSASDKGILIPVGGGSTCYVYTVSNSGLSDGNFGYLDCSGVAVTQTVEAFSFETVCAIQGSINLGGNLDLSSSQGVACGTSALANSWTSYLGIYESIQLKIIVNSAGNAIRYLGLWTGSGTIGIGSNVRVDFGASTKQQFIEVSIIKTESSGYLVFYNTCGGLCGKLV
jgi:hypothetical protein